MSSPRPLRFRGRATSFVALFQLATLDGVIDFASMDWHFFRRFHTQTDLVAADLYHNDRYFVVDNDAFIFFAIELTFFVPSQPPATNLSRRGGSSHKYGGAAMPYFFNTAQDGCSDAVCPSIYSTCRTAPVKQLRDSNVAIFCSASDFCPITPTLDSN